MLKSLERPARSVSAPELYRAVARAATAHPAPRENVLLTVKCCVERRVRQTAISLAEPVMAHGATGTPEVGRRSLGGSSHARTTTAGARGRRALLAARGFAVAL